MLHGDLGANAAVPPWPLLHGDDEHRATAAIFSVTAEDPAGEWSEPLWFDPDGWDPSLLFDDDGTAYLSRNGTVDGSYGIIQYAMDVRSGRPLEAAGVAGLGRLWS